MMDAVEGVGKISPVVQPVIFVGTSGWTYDHWKGRFYPQGLPKSHWFEYYASRFSSVEVNATFYRTFKDQTYHTWRERAPQRFGYVLKVPQLITHRKYLVDVDQDIKGFCQSCALLGDKFEMVLLQVAPNMPYHPGHLQKALAAFPDPHRVAVEFRRSEWLNPEIMAVLRAMGVAICNVDSPQQSIPDYLTSNRAYLRLHGRQRWYSYNYSSEELREIARLALNLVERGAERIYIFFNNDYEGYAPANAIALKGILR
jgi:uncharacterized protein YecE (DUF72 family)